MKTGTVWMACTTCDLCHRVCTSILVDGRTHHGPWAVMCEDCHKSFGVGLGTGRGQLYLLQGDQYRLAAGGFE